MTHEEAYEIVTGMGCHPYSRFAMIDALLEGEKIGKREQKALDEKRIAELEAKFDALVGLNEELCNTIDEYKRKKVVDINKACEWFGNYLMEIGYPDDWMRDSSVIESGEQRFRKVMEN